MPEGQAELLGQPFPYNSRGHWAKADDPANFCLTSARAVSSSNPLQQAIAKEARRVLGPARF